MIQAPRDRAQSRSCSRRDAVIVTPSGYWCEGVTYTARARAQRAAPVPTSRPPSSTGTGTRSAPAIRSASRAAVARILDPDGAARIEEDARRDRQRLLRAAHDHDLAGVAPERPRRAQEIGR